MMRSLAAGRKHDHPVLEQPGWWRRPDRLFHPGIMGRSYARPPEGPGIDMADRSARPLLIAGSTGTLGSAFARLCDVRGIPYHILTRQEMNITDVASVDTVLDVLSPWAVVNAAGYVRVDQAEREPDRCSLANVTGPAVLATACARHGISLLTFSSDLVFDGTRDGAYVESDPVSPLNVYGRSKAEAEARVLDILPQALVVRTAAFFGPWDDFNFVTLALRALSAGERFTAADDAVVSPTYIVDLVHAALDLLIDNERGVWHLSNQGAVTWAELARRSAELAGVHTGVIVARPTRELRLAAPRPRNSALSSKRGLLLPPLEDALVRYLAHRKLAETSVRGAQVISASRPPYRQWQYRHMERWA
jgi:dTDP-4-dehydrorhamnose reductase